MKTKIILTTFFFASLYADFSTEQWEAKAYEFALNDSSEFRDERLSYILEVIYDPDFQNDPEQYLADWTEERGWTREYRFIEDAALEFFRKSL